MGNRFKPGDIVRCKDKARQSDVAVVLYVVSPTSYTVQFSDGGWPLNLHLSLRGVNKYNKNNTGWHVYEDDMTLIKPAYRDEKDQIIDYVLHQIPVDDDF